MRAKRYHLPVTLHEAYQALCLPRDATAAQVKGAYRRMVSEAHPDRGGQAAEFIRVRAAYEILSAFLQQGLLEDDMPIPAGLREVIDSIVQDFREQQHWAEAQTLAHLAHFEKHMTSHIQTATRADLRQFSTTFGSSWDALVNALFTKCNSRCDTVLQRYETWYTQNTQAFFDGLYRRELLHFGLRRRFWEVFLILGAIAGALTVVVGWEGPWRRWVSLGMILLAGGVAFLAHLWSAKRQRQVREKVEPLSVVVFEIDKHAMFPTEATLRRGRRTTTALGLAGAYLGNAVTGGFAVPVVGAVAGAALGGGLDRLFNPTGRMRKSMEQDLARFMAMARPQVTSYVLEAHIHLLDEVRGQIVDSYQERVKGTVRLLTEGSGGGRP
ncbi:MAG: hypothetical protein A2133_06220 [Actinobacteria bacterium RBG_16_64_13]|nr:MAG: hypothetical protein A2133_06220 [Actinobacteria bacterium RBG_16_64_13]